MITIDSKTVIVSTFLELKDVLETQNTYNYIYINQNIISSDNISISSTKEKITIDGTYQNNMITYINYDYKINLSPINKLIVKNINIINSNTGGLFFTPNDRAYLNTTLDFYNITLNGTCLANMLKSNITVNDGTIMLSEANNVSPTYFLQAGGAFIGGLTYIDSSSTINPLFLYNAGFPSPKLYFLPNSDITITLDTKELMGGTTKLDFRVLHGAKVNLQTGNGFSPAPSQGCLDVLIDTCATLNFLETSHHRVPMWTIYNSLTILENATLNIVNDVSSAPSDNYNIYFKGTNPSITINDPKSIIFYTKNSNIIYTDNELNFEINASRINLWNTTNELSTSGTINNKPDYYWFNKEILAHIKGVLTSSTTSITEHNLETDVSNFSFQNKKVLSIGNSPMNIYPIDSNSLKINGYAQNLSEIEIKYLNETHIVDVNDEGFFELNLPNNIIDDTNITITSCVPGSFIYETKEITTPFTGEITLMNATEKIAFVLNPIGVDPYVFPRDKELSIKVVDSRLTGSNFKIIATLSNTLQTDDGITLEGAIVFKSFDNQITVLSTYPKPVLQAKNNEGIPTVYNHTLSTEKGILLYLDNKYLHINKLYSTSVKWRIQK